jgi:hypothetical protein
MQFNLKIIMDNDGMRTGADLAFALRALAEKIDDYTQSFDDPADESGFDRIGLVWDANGNRVGKWNVKQ